MTFVVVILSNICLSDSYTPVIPNFLFKDDVGPEDCLRIEYASFVLACRSKRSMRPSHKLQMQDPARLD